MIDAGLFLLEATVLLGSPGPAIAALLSVGRSEGFLQGLKFYGGLQIGLAGAAAASAAGLFSMIEAIPTAGTIMTAAAAAYLAYLAYKIATSPVGVELGQQASGFAATAVGGLLLGVTNPKAYVAFASLMASASLVPSDHAADMILKWIGCVIVMVLVDIVWLWAGVMLRSLGLMPRSERLLNIGMGATILATAVLTIL